MTTKIIAWNINGMKAQLKKDFEYAFERFKENRKKETNKIPDNVMGMYT